MTRYGSDAVEMEIILHQLYTSLIGLRNDFIAGKGSIADLGLTFEV